MLGSGRSRGEQSRRRRLTAACASCLAIGVLIGGLVGSQSVAGKSGGPTAHTADVQMLFGALVKLDRKLTNVIDDVEAHGWGGRGQGNLVQQIVDAKARMIDQYFGQSVYGIKFSEVVHKLDCVDALLNYGLGVARGAGASVGAQDDRVIVAAFRDAKACKQKLENDLHKANATGGTTIGTTVGTPTIGTGG